MSTHEHHDFPCSASKKKSIPLAQYVKEAIETYLEHLDGHKPVNLHQLVIEETEKSLLITVMNYAKNNQCKVATILGISRGTLRKKLKLYKINLH